MGNPATPSNETDRLSYLHRLASINSRGWYTHTKASTRVYPSLDAQGDAVTSGQPTHQPPIYLRPKRNSRIYFTYALLPPYFQLYGHRPRAQTDQHTEKEKESARARFLPHKEPFDLPHRNRFSARFRASLESASLVE